ncbi:hypothetical protein [Hyphobacterium sp.]|uniref:hypothetical protein n=1 Tax=Hyphobacterium sp. TaxID=2004662 RepID=UPI003BA89991
MSQSAEKFDFDTVFSASGEVLRDGKRVKRMLTPEEVEEIRQQAFSEGAQSETAKAAQAQADALRAVASQMQLILARLETESANLREQSAVLAKITAKKLAGAALSSEADAAVIEFCASVMQDLRGAPHFKVTCAEAIAGEVSAALEQIASEAGFDGGVVVRASAEKTGADCQLDWGQGGVERSFEDIEARVDGLIADWLAAPEEETVLPPETAGTEPAVEEGDGHD